VGGRSREEEGSPPGRKERERKLGPKEGFGKSKHGLLQDKAWHCVKKTLVCSFSHSRLSTKAQGRSIQSRFEKGGKRGGETDVIYWGLGGEIGRERRDECLDTEKVRVAGKEEQENSLQA